MIAKRTIALNPNHFGAFAGMGHVYVRLGKVEEAIEAYKEARWLLTRTLSLLPRQFCGSAARHRADKVGLYG